MMDGDFELRMRRGYARGLSPGPPDVREFGLAWEDCERFLKELGVIPPASTSTPADPSSPCWREDDAVALRRGSAATPRRGTWDSSSTSTADAKAYEVEFVLSTAAPWPVFETTLGAARFAPSRPARSPTHEPRHGISPLHRPPPPFLNMGPNRDVVTVGIMLTGRSE